MEDSTSRRRLLQRILMGWVVLSGAMPLGALADSPSLAIHEPVFAEPPADAASPSDASRPFLAVREPTTAVAAFRPVREPGISPAAPTIDIAALPQLPDTAPGDATQTAPPVARPEQASIAKPLNALAWRSGDNEFAGERSPADSRWLRKRALAQQVSREILGATQARMVAAPAPNVSTMTARRLAQQAADQLAQARRQLDRGTLLSARGSAFETLRLIADANDLLTGTVSSATALQAARTALRESEDFAGRFGPVGPEAIARMAASHQTTILKDCDTSQLNGSRATDIYLDYARSQLAEVADSNPIAIEALVVLSQVERQSESPGTLRDAMVISLLRAAIQAGPHDPVVANELGFQLLQQGLLEEAQWALEHSFRLHPTRSAGVNLAETLRQRGDLHGAQAMFASLQPIPPEPAPQPQVYALSPQQFAAFSQPTAPPQRQPIGQPQRPLAAQPQLQPLPQPVAAPPAPTPTPAAPVQPAESKGPLGRVADAVSQFWK
ncbi:tetratricopeptide repeat protein [Roseimaritima ulvae]|uniref:Tetratricopeptide repeat protein n=1 Tax=Roseimaritima ulvae TaxID=980254 RepID=A0A5B9QSI2_9BACT|nr:hypothetical protein [Roseimaritima ulvae]QEG40355.1 hypothetical protein UC8_23640 [Roseimaritima ulvae]